MVNFKAGQVVKCIRNSYAPELIVGAHYTVKSVRPGTGGVTLEEVAIQPPVCSGYFAEDRFIPVDPLSDDWFEEILTDKLELAEVLEESGAEEKVKLN